jgi:Putative restriction endonuclease
MVSSPTSSVAPSPASDELAERGWRAIAVTQPDGTTRQTLVPLTSEEFLHPKKGFHLPNNTFHDDIAGNTKDLLNRRYANDETVGVFRDLIVKWDIPHLGDHCPNTFVAFGLQNKDQNRSQFVVADEGVRPAFILEVVSPRYRKEDREVKVVEYARARVQEYVILDRRKQRGQVLEEVLGYRLVEGHYQPISPDEEGRIFCATVGLWISLHSGRLVMEDAQTGQRLLTSAELEVANQELEAAKERAEQQAATLEALLARYRKRFGDLPENNGES